MTIPIDGNLWVPLEITFIGEEDFPAAWKSGAEEFARFSGDGKALGLYFTREAQSVYRPVGFEERDLGLQYGDRTKIVRDFDDALNKATRLVIEDYQKTAMEDNSKGSWNRLGIVAAMYEDYPVAEKAFYSALSLDRNYVPPKVNLANVYYKQEEYQNALRLYHEAEARLRDTGQTGSVSYARLLLNISRTYYEVENFSQAARYSERLSEVSPELADRYAYLADGAGGRAANVGAASDILYIEE
jgi:tetratricopeptide (TPR) repeat protein